MKRFRILGIVTFVLLGLCNDVVVKAQDTENPREGRGQREGGRRRGGFGGGRGGGGGFPGGGFRGGARGGLLGLMRVEEVRDELQIGEVQQELLQVLRDDLNEGRPDLPTNFRDMSDEEREAFREELQEWTAKQAKDAKATLVTILEPEQYKRLMEINIQNQGAAALSDEEVAAKLKLSDEQKTKIAATIQENAENSRDQMREAFQGRGAGGFDFAAIREKIEAMRKEGDERVLASLNDRQKASFEALKGEAFDMPAPSSGGGRGGRGGFGGGGGGGRGNRPQRPNRPE